MLCAERKSAVQKISLACAMRVLVVWERKYKNWALGIYCWPFRCPFRHLIKSKMWYEILPAFGIIVGCITATGLGLKGLDRLFLGGKVRLSVYDHAKYFGSAQAQVCLRPVSFFWAVVIWFFFVWSHLSLASKALLTKFLWPNFYVLLSLLLLLLLF